MAKKFYVNVYDVKRCYGGPEEGGWYYDCGEPSTRVDVVSKRVRNRREAVRLMRQMERRCPKKRPGRYACHVTIEKVPPKAFPTRRPRYE